MAHRIKVMAIISGIAVGDPLGGAERLALDVARHLDRARFAPRICALMQFDTAAERNWLKRLTDENIPVLFASPATRKHPVSFLANLRSIVRQNGDQTVDILHSYVPLAALMSLALKKRLGTRALVRTAGGGHEWGDGPTSFLARQLFTNWVYPLVFDQETCVSREMKQRFDRRPGARLAGKQALFTCTAVDLARFRPQGDRAAIKRDLGFGPDTLLVGSVGRLSAEKGFQDLLEAAALVHQQLPEVCFAHFGNGPLWASLQRRRAELGIDDVFQFFGARDDLHLLYNAMDLFVLPSHWEGLPGVVIESMACGAPVVATAIPGTQELVIDGATGWLAPPCQPAQLAAVIETALRNPQERERRAARALADIAPQYGLDALVRQYEAVYEQVWHHATAGRARGSAV